MKTKQKAPAPTDEVNRLIDDLGPVWRRLYLLSLPFQERHDLGLRGLWILRYIRRGDVYPSALAAALVTSPSLVSAEINRLIAAKMVTRESAEHDGRRSRLTLTQKALEVLAESQVVYDQVLHPIFEGFSDAERKTFFSLLEALSQDMLQAAPAKDDRARVRQLEAENRRLRQMLSGRENKGPRKGR